MAVTGASCSAHILIRLHDKAAPRPQLAASFTYLTPRCEPPGYARLHFGTIRLISFCWWYAILPMPLMIGWIAASSSLIRQQFIANNAAAITMLTPWGERTLCAIGRSRARFSRRTPAASHVWYFSAWQPTLAAAEALILARSYWGCDMRALGRSPHRRRLSRRQKARQHYRFTFFDAVESLPGLYQSIFTLLRLSFPRCFNNTSLSLRRAASAFLPAKAIYISLYRAPGRRYAVS